MLLKKNPGLSSAEIGEEFRLHKVTVRQHLSALLTQGYVYYRKKKLNRGRPQNIYYLTTKGISEFFPGRYSGFALGLLDSVIAIDGEQKLHKLLQQEMEQKANDFFEGSEAKSLREKVVLLAEFFNQQGYMVELEETVDAFIFREHHCALINLVKKHNQICQVELSFLKRLLGQNVERESHINMGDNCCSYRIPKLEKI